MKQIAVMLLMCLALASCSKDRLYVQSDYINYEYLASTYAGTPDPRKMDPWVGQRILVGWKLPDEYMVKDNLRLVLRLRFRDKSEDLKTVPVKTHTGTYVYKLMHQEFHEKKGILTYQATIMAGENEVLEQWKHQIWAERFDVAPATTP